MAQAWHCCPGGEQLSLKRGAGDCRPDVGGVARLNFGGVDMFEEIAVAVEEGARKRKRCEPGVVDQRNC